LDPCAVWTLCGYKGVCGRTGIRRSLVGPLSDPLDRIGSSGVGSGHLLRLALDVQDPEGVQPDDGDVGRPHQPPLLLLKADRHGDRAFKNWSGKKSTSPDSVTSMAVRTIRYDSWCLVPLFSGFNSLGLRPKHLSLCLPHPGFFLRSGGVRPGPTQGGSGVKINPKKGTQNIFPACGRTHPPPPPRGASPTLKSSLAPSCRLREYGGPDGPSNANTFLTACEKASTAPDHLFHALEPSEHGRQPGAPIGRTGPVGAPRTKWCG